MSWDISQNPWDALETIIEAWKYVGKWRVMRLECIYSFFKGQPNGRLEKISRSTLQASELLSDQALTGSEKHEIWKESVWKPNVGDRGKVDLLLGDSRCHNQEPFLKVVQSIGTNAEIFSGGYTCVLLPFNVGMITSLKHEIRKYFVKEALNAYSERSSSSSLPAPTKNDVIVDTQCD